MQSYYTVCIYVPGGPGFPLGPAGPSGPCGPATPVRPMGVEMNTFMLMILMQALTHFGVMQTQWTVCSTYTQGKFDM